MRSKPNEQPQMRMAMQPTITLAKKIAARLIERRETIAVAESSTGGLIAAALLSVLGASAYFVGGAVVYTKVARVALLDIGDADMQGLRPATEAYSLLVARRVRERHGATWGLGETGATGPSGNRYGDPAGHACMAVAGPIERATTLETGSCRADRTRDDVGNGQRRPAGEYGCFCQARARASLRGGIGQGLAQAIPQLPPSPSAPRRATRR